MPLVVRASVVNITTDTPLSTDHFLVDTNIWLWLTYAPLTLNDSGKTLQQAIDYPNYFKLALEVDSSIYSSGLIYAELAHNIERTERAIYNSNLAKPLESKFYRHEYPKQRAKVTDTVSEAWSLIIQASTMLNVNLDTAFMQDVDKLLPTVELDGYDVFTALLAKQSGITNILTDDGDFASVPGLTIFTANKKVIDLAAEAGKLVTR